MAISFYWSGSPVLTAVHNGGGSVTFTLSGGKCWTRGFIESDVESSYCICCGDTVLGYLSNSTYTTTIAICPSNYTYTCKGYLYTGGVTYYSSSGNPTNTLSIPAPDFIYSDGAKLEGTVSGSDMVLTFTGSVTLTNGYGGNQIYYNLYYGDTQKTGWYRTETTWTITGAAGDTQLAWKVCPYIVMRDPVQNQYLAWLDSGLIWIGVNCVKYYDGTDWVECELLYYDGTDWIECKPYYYNGSGWVEISS